MLTKTSPTLLTQHGRIAPPPSSWLPTHAPQRLETHSSVPYGWQPYGILTGRDEVLFEADPLRFVNDPRFAGRIPAHLKGSER